MVRRRLAVFVIQLGPFLSCLVHGDNIIGSTQNLSIDPVDFFSGRPFDFFARFASDCSAGSIIVALKAALNDFNRSAGTFGVV